MLSPLPGGEAYDFFFLLSPLMFLRVLMPSKGYTCLCCLSKSAVGPIEFCLTLSNLSFFAIDSPLSGDRDILRSGATVFPEIFRLSYYNSFWGLVSSSLGLRVHLGMDTLIWVIDRGIDYSYSFKGVAELTVVLVPASLSTQMENVVAPAVGMDVETTSMVLGMFLCYPLGLIMVSLPYGRMKHLFSFLLGAFLLQFVLDVQWIHQVTTFPQLHIGPLSFL